MLRGWSFRCALTALFPRRICTMATQTSPAASCSASLTRFPVLRELCDVTCLVLSAIVFGRNSPQALARFLNHRADLHFDDAFQGAGSDQFASQSALWRVWAHDRRPAGGGVDISNRASQAGDSPCLS